MRVIDKIAQRLSRSDMKGYEMYFEWNWPHMLKNGWSNIVWWSFDINTALRGDHTPMIYVSWCVCNCMILDFSYYNVYHEVEES